MQNLWTPASRAAVDSKLTLSGGFTGFTSGYSLVPETVDVKLARALYRNNDARYKLGAGFARPALNIPVGFMGVPEFEVENPSTQEVLDATTARWRANILRSHLALTRDGEVLLRAQQGNRSPAYAKLFGEEKWVDLTYATANTFEIDTEETDILAIKGVKLIHLVLIKDDNGGSREVKMYETWTADKRIIEWENNVRPKKEEPNNWGFVPAVYLKNSGEDNELHGHSELEPMEPYMRFYHDVMLHAGAASQLHSTAKLILRVDDVERFLQHNFEAAEVADGRLSFKNKDVLFFEDTGYEAGLGAADRAGRQGAEIIQALAPLGDTTTLLEFIFLNIVDVSEVPEWAFGGAIASSKASVSEQSAPLIHKVSRKRELTTEAWEMIGRMALAMLGATSPVTVSWDDLAIKDVKYEAEAFKTRVEALVELQQNETISRTSMAEDLRDWIPGMLPYLADAGPDEAGLIAQERIAMADALLQEMDDDELSRIESEGREDQDEPRPVR